MKYFKKISNFVTTPNTPNVVAPTSGATLRPRTTPRPKPPGTKTLNFQNPKTNTKNIPKQTSVKTQNIS